MAPTRNPATGGGRDHALYWISMAWLCNLSLGLLLRNLLYSSGPKNVAGQSRKVLRHERKVRCLSRKRRKSLWLLYLTLRGQTEPIADLQLHPAVHGGDLQPCGEALRRKIMSDKAKAADTLLEPLEQAPGKQAIRLLKPLRLGKRHRDIGQRPLPIVRLKSGEVASTPEEAFQRCKKKHFGEIEGGSTTTPSAAWTSATASRASRPAQNTVWKSSRTRPDPWRVSQVSWTMDCKRALATPTQDLLPHPRATLV